MLQSSNILANNNIRMTLRKSIKISNSDNDFNYIYVFLNIFLIYF